MTDRLLSFLFGAALTVVIGGAVVASQSVAQDQSAGASEDAYPDKVVARINGEPVTAAQLSLAKDELGQYLAQVPERAHEGMVFRHVVQLNLMADAAREAGLTGTQDYQQLARYYEMRALRDIFFQREIRGNITDDAARKLYDERVGSAEPEEEIKARHILVETEEEATAVIQKLADGADFAELAKTESTGPTGSNGGDLGYFTREQMVTPFAETAFAMETGEISEPVQTQFGWHVIKVEDKRESQPPKFADIKERLKSALVTQRLQTRMAELRDSANIEILDESLKEAAQPARPGNMQPAPDPQGGAQAQ